MFNLSEAIKEVEMQENDTQWMNKEYKDILKDQEAILAQMKERPKTLEYLAGIVTDLYMDWNKMRGKDVKHKMVELKKILVKV